MPALNEVVQHVSKLPKKQRQVITKLIDMKTEENMDKVLAKLEAMESKLNSRIDAIKWLISSSIAVTGLLVAIVTHYLK